MKITEFLIIHITNAVNCREPDEKRAPDRLTTCFRLTKTSGSMNFISFPTGMSELSFQCESGAGKEKVRFSVNSI
jgi:hypothetical protein